MSDDRNGLLIQKDSLAMMIIAPKFNLSMNTVNEKK